jgi:hypothetical protein
VIGLLSIVGVNGDRKTRGAGGEAQILCHTPTCRVQVVTGHNVCRKNPPELHPCKAGLTDNLMRRNGQSHESQRCVRSCVDNRDLYDHNTTVCLVLLTIVSYRR